MKNYSARAKAIISLQERGYDHDFILRNECLLCIQQCELIGPDQFEVTETYRFDGEPRANDNSIIYAIKSLQNDIKGILMTSCSPLTIKMPMNLWSKLATPLNEL